jgi:Ca2+-dependent lipid-binding protein
LNLSTKKDEEENIGELNLTIVGGFDLRDVKILGSMDPYVTIKYGSKIYKTNPHISGHKDPKWN